MRSKAALAVYICRQHDFRPARVSVHGLNGHTLSQTKLKARVRTRGWRESAFWAFFNCRLPLPLPLKTGHRVPAAQPRPTASSPLFSQIASRWFDILPWQPEEANLDLARAIPPPPRARHCTCPPARPSAILEEPPGFRRQDLRRDASEQPRWLISDASEHPRAEPTRLRDFV